MQHCFLSRLFLLFPAPWFATPSAFWWSCASGLFEAGYVVTLAISLAQSAFGKAYIIMRGMAMIIVWFISTLFLGEKMGLLSLLAISAVLSGLFLTSQTVEPKQSKQLLFPLLCGLCIAGYHLCYGRSLAHGANPAALFAAALWLALPGIVLFMTKEQRQLFKGKIKTGWKRMSFGGMLSALSFLLFLLGLRYSEAGLALTLRNTHRICTGVCVLHWRENHASAMEWSIASHYWG